MKKFYVKLNKCRCHLENCNCNEWVIFHKYNEKEIIHSTHFLKENAYDFCDLMNERAKNESKRRKNIKEEKGYDEYREIGLKVTTDLLQD